MAGKRFGMCKNHTVAVVFILLILLVQTTCLFADDGSWNSLFDISGGSVYSEDDDPAIVLEKELLIFNGKSTEAHFLFRNTSDSEIILECGFPVTHHIGVENIPDDAVCVPVQKYNNRGTPGLDFFETYAPDSGRIVIPINEINNSREFIGRDIPDEAGVEFRIVQDGRQIDIDDILLERSVGQEFAGLTFHFKHRLYFPARDTTVVSVFYTQDLLYGNDGGAACDVFKWNYVIGTGSTWGGPIGEFFFIKPSGWAGRVKGPSRLQLPDDYGVDVFHIENWEPDLDEEFSLVMRPVTTGEEFSFYSDIQDYKEIWLEGLSRMDISSRGLQSCVKNVSASSSLSGEIEIFLDNGMISAADFSALSAFDGFEETSWCENVQGRGRGEYLEAEVTGPVIGLVIRNGFKRMPFDDWVYETGVFDRNVRDDKSGFKDYFAMNSRVGRLNITDVNGRLIAGLDISDQRDPQLFFGLDLPPAVYRFVIADTFEGAVWDDTCIAEITFITKKDASTDQLFTDSFFGKVFGVRQYE